MINLLKKLNSKLFLNSKPKNLNTIGGKKMKKVKIIAKGRVQGVGFRFMTKMVADQIGIFGSVRNQPDGTVYIEANGEPDKINLFIEEIRKSPSPSGKVDHLEVTKDSSLPERIKFSITN